jgi:hypothetical protein
LFNVHVPTNLPRDTLLETVFLGAEQADKTTISDRIAIEV